MSKYACRAFIVLCILMISGQAKAWHDKTHISIARAAGYEYWFNAAGADIAKIKADKTESYNHWYDNNRQVEITPQMVLAQAGRYNRTDKASDAQGHLYGAIIAALRAYESCRTSAKYCEYHLAYAAHYIGDLSNPLHNIPYDDYNAVHHQTNDGVVENTILDHPERITRHMYAIILRDNRFEPDLAREIARIANLSRKLGYKLREGKRDMTSEEACIQLGHSASLLKAVLKHFKKA
ncbi:MAG TPA: hypothetical protein VMU10_11645 [Desulfomonilia bacterium]|nr:hypothetical protein [Desulfomonilia bacterium]